MFFNRLTDLGLSAMHLSTALPKRSMKMTADMMGFDNHAGTHPKPQPHPESLRRLDADLNAWLQLGQEGVNVTKDALLNLMDPSMLATNVFTMPARMVDNAKLMARPDTSPHAMREALNKLEVFFLIKMPPDYLNIPRKDQDHFPLADLVTQADDLSEFRRIWFYETLSHFHTKFMLKQSSQPTQMFTSIVKDLPEHALLMLQAGMGQAMVEGAMADLRKDRITQVVRRMLDNISANILPGYDLIIMESLGLTISSLKPAYVRAVDAVVQKLNPKMRYLYWQGVGRGAYFRMQNWPPLSGSYALDTIAAEAPNPHLQLNAQAGYALAVIMVNLRHPEVIDHLYVQPMGKRLLRDNAFSSGARMSAVIRAASAPDKNLDHYLAGYQPKQSKELWQQLVVDPFRKGAAVDLKAAIKAGNAAEIFNPTA